MPSFESEPTPDIEEKAVFYDKTTVDKIVALAGRLQDQHRESLTAQQIESIGGEVGLEPAFVRQAVAQIPPHAPPAHGAGFKFLRTANPTLVACVVPAACLAFVALLLPGEEFASLRQTALLTVAAIQGFLLNNQKQGFVAGIMTTAVVRVAALMGAALQWGADAHLAASHNPMGTLASIIAAGSYVGVAGLLGAIMRRPFLSEQQKQEMAAQEQAQKARKQAEEAQKQARAAQQGQGQPAAGSENVTRAELLDALFALQSRLQEQMQHRAFLSIDVVGSSQHKRQSPALAVEYSFGQFRQWAEAVVAGQNGQIHSAAGDGLMAMFDNDVSACRAARALQTQIIAFNTQYNRLPEPIAIRCGISAGEVPVESGKPIGDLQSPIVDRAANRQKQAPPGAVALGAELTAPALTELGMLKPLPDAEGETLFCWQPSASVSAAAPVEERTMQTAFTSNRP